VRLPWYVGLALTLVSLTACQKVPLDEALRGKLAPAVANEIITEYCQSCHIHRTFDAIGHVSRVHALYDREPYTTATECRLCHMVRQDTWGMRRRKTLWPAQVAQRASNAEQ
jgi:hypothetical protein